ITNKVIQLDAQYNFWNLGTSPNRNNHYAWFYDGNGIFDDATSHRVNGNNFFITPLNIDAACPSRLSISTGGGGQGSFGKTSNIHSTKFIDSLSNVPYKNGQNLKQAMQHIYSYSNDTTDSGLNDQIDYYEQVLKHNFGTHKSKAAPALSSAYRKMNQGISVGLRHGIIQHHSASPQLNRLIHLQDTLLNRTAANDSMNRYKLLTDKALTLRLANRRMDAMPLLNQAHNLANKNGKKYIEKWQCFIDKEMRLQNGLITKQQFLAEIKLCGAPDTTMSKRSQYDYVTTENEVVAKTEAMLESVTKTEVILYPNPALDNLNIEIKNLPKESTINILVFDIVGRIMYTGTQHANEKNAMLNIPINLSSGTYFIKLEGEQINETKRFSVLK
ncbi:MAG: T9SS type A sorting domain-containing protein, partial [Bacteroidota bacterium]